MLPSTIQNLINLLSRLPGFGQRSAARLVLWLLNQPNDDLKTLAQAIENLKKQTNICKRCFNLISNGSEICLICNDLKRDHSIICVIEDALDMLPIERTKYYQGVYHILGGLISPPDGIGPEKLHIQELIKRISLGKETSENFSEVSFPRIPKNPPVKEIILALNPTTEGDTTALYLERLLKDLDTRLRCQSADSVDAQFSNSAKSKEKIGIKITRLGRGLSTGSDLEYADEATLSSALKNRG